MARFLLRCIKLSIIHDIAEAIVGDLVPNGPVSKEEKYQLEYTGIQKLQSLVSPEVGEELEELWLEYETASTNEAKLVKDLDKFEMIVQALEYEKRTQNGQEDVQLI